LFAGSQDDARESARLALNGKGVTVRLYLDWQTDPKAYTTVSVALEGLDVSFEAIRLAYAQSGSSRTAESLDGSSMAGLTDAIVVVTAADQRDQAVINLLRDFIYAEPYRSSQRFTLWPRDVSWVHKEPCLFTDALQQPIPNAEVEILIGDYPDHMNAHRKVWVANARLDANGKLTSPKSTSSICCFLFVVIHPDCGPVPARSRWMVSKPGSGHPLSVPALPKEQWCVFLDAMGNPIPGATVDVFDGCGWESEGQNLLETIALDERGRLRPPRWRPLLDECCFLVSDPNYGIAVVEPYDKMRRRPEERLTTCVVPLVAIGTRADERSLWGTVVDANENPIPEAVVKCSMIGVPGGGRLSAFFPGTYPGERYVQVLTDSEGRFAMHLPLAKDDGTLGRPVPPGAEYGVLIESPRNPNLLPYRGSLVGGQAHTVALRPPPLVPENFTGTLVFADESGPVVDPERLAYVTLTIQWQAEGPHVNTYGGSGMQMKKLPFGTYSATANWPGGLYVFGPIEVTPESPDTIVFEPVAIRQARVTYRGRVVHAVTGAPVANATVMREPSGSAFRGTGLDSEEMDDVQYFGPEIDQDSELFRILQQNSYLGTTHTVADGRYEITLPIGRETALYGIVSMGRTTPSDNLVVIKKDYLGALQQVQIQPPGADESGQPRDEVIRPDAGGKAVLPDMKLFPAATVLIEPNKPKEVHEKTDIRFYYHTAPDDPTPWVKDLWATPRENQGGSVLRTYELRPNRLQSVYVPADVTLTLEVQLLDARYAPVVVEDVRLAHRQVLDLGHVEFARAMQIAVKVINSTGNPVEGVAVHRIDQWGYLQSQRVVSDGEGIARIFVPPHSRGQLVVDHWPDGASEVLREGITYQVAGDEDMGKEFVLLLSDAFIERLRESGQDTRAPLPSRGAPPPPSRYRGQQQR
jgi:hypothetical protein